jgi:hypothetical protein
MTVLDKLDVGLHQGNTTRIGAFQGIPSYILDFIPTLMIWIFTMLLPGIISWTDRYLVGHSTQSSENHDIMKKTFW